MKIRIKSKKTQKKFPPSLSINLFISKPLWIKPLIDNLIDLLCKYKEWMPDQWIRGFDKKKMAFSEESKAEVIKAFQPFSRGFTDVRTKEGIVKEEVIGFEIIEFFRKTPPKYSLNMNQHSGQKRDVPNNITFYINADSLKSNNCESLFMFIYDICNVLRVDFCQIQYFTSEEVTNAGYGKVSYAFDKTYHLSSRTLYYKYIPDLYNVTIWGKPYIDFFGKEKLLNTPCYKVEELPSGVIWMQLSPDVCGEKGTMDALKDVREKVKAYLNNDAFFNTKYPRNELFDEDLHKYNLPKFDLSEIQAQ